MSSRRLYHVAPFELSDTIWADGIDPAYSKGKNKVAWFVTSKNVIWAIGHVCRKKHIPIEDMTVFAVKVSERQLIKSCWRGIWSCAIVIRPVAEVPAVWKLDDHRMKLLR